MINTIFFSVLKGKKFRTRDGKVLELVGLDPQGAGVVCVLMQDQEGKYHDLTLLTIL